MTIFLISRGYPSKRDPQWGSFEKDQAEALAQLGHKVIILSFDARFRPYWRPIGIRHFMHGDVASINIFLVPSAIISLLFGKRINQRFKAWQLDKVYRQAVKLYGKPDIIYSHYLTNTMFAVTLKLKYNIPLIGIEHWSELGKTPIKPYIIPIAKHTYDHVDQLISVSAALQQSIKEQIGNDSIVVHNMVGKEFFYKSSTTPRPFTFVATGSLIHRKGFDLLPIAFNEIKHLLPNDWQMIIIGSGEEYIALQQQIEHAKLQNHIHLVGQKNKKQIVQILQNSDVFILPSRGENFSVAVLEALACGLPVIASITGGIRECINQQNGILFPVDDTHALADAIQTMYNNRENYDHQLIANDCQARFAPAVIAQQLTDIFQHVISQCSTSNIPYFSVYKQRTK